MAKKKKKNNNKFNNNNNKNANNNNVKKIVENHNINQNVNKNTSNNNSNKSQNTKKINTINDKNKQNSGKKQVVIDKTQFTKRVEKVTEVKEVKETKVETVKKDNENKIKSENTEKIENLNAKVKERLENKDKKEEVIVTNSKEIQKDIEKVENLRKTTKKHIIIPIILFILILIIVGLSYFYSLNNVKIAENTYINGVNVSSLSKNDAKAAIEQYLSENNNKEVTLKYQDFEYILNSDIFEFTPKIDKAVENAYNIGKSDNMFVDTYEYIVNKFGKNEVELEFQYNNELLDEQINSVSSKLPSVVQQPTYSLEEKVLIITSGKNGITVEKEKLKENVLNIFKSKNHASVLEIPSKIEVADKIDIEKIYKEVKRDPKDASFDQATNTLTVEQKGIEFAISIDEAKKMILEEKEEYEIPIKYIEPKIKVVDLNTNGAFGKVQGRYSTKYNAGLTERTTNLILAARKINGIILQPGEVFSFNKVVGKRTVQSGFKNATIISNGKYVSDIGGGICQISSTLYNAALYSDLEIVERHNHALPVSYCEPGRDATVYYGSLDFRFRNNKSYPIKVDIFVGGGTATAIIRGIEENTTKVNVFTKKSAKNEVLTYKERIINGISQGINIISRDIFRTNVSGAIDANLPVVNTPTPTPAPVSAPKEEKKPEVKPETNTNTNNDKGTTNTTGTTTGNSNTGTTTGNTNTNNQGSTGNTSPDNNSGTTEPRG